LSHSIQIQCNNNHLLFNLLPPPSTSSQNYSLQTRPHSQQNARVSECPDAKITKFGLTRSGTECFIAVPIWQHWA